MLLQLHEPGGTPLPHHDQESIAVGIDLGTTHSVVGIAQGGVPTILQFEEGPLVPSVVAFTPQGVVVGQAARVQNTESKVFASVKRHMGHEEAVALSKAEIQQKIAPSAVEVSAEILKHLKARAEESLGKAVRQAVITVPAYFDELARVATKQAAQIAGLEVLRLLNEPTAAALAYGLDTGVEGVYAIYDLGGGTFDVSILRLRQGLFQVLATSGDTHLGGDDFDGALLDALANRHGVSLPSPLPDDLRLKGRLWKEALSASESVSYTLPYAGGVCEGVITRQEFEDLIRPALEQTLVLCQGALADAELSVSQVEGVVLVGGSSRLPLVQRLVASFFGKAPLKNINPDEVVAAGAALQAEALTRGSQTLLLDVTPLSLGLETMGGVVEKIIPRNSPLPILKEQEFTTYQDGQTAMLIHVVQGERELVKDCRSLARFELRGIPPMVAGAAHVRVTFTIDADGLLTVSAEEITTGTRQQVEVRPSYGLSEEALMTLLQESMAHGREDMERRLLIETQVEARRLLLTLEGALAQDKRLLSPDEEGRLRQKMHALAVVLEGENRPEIQKALDELDQQSQLFAEKRLTEAMRQSLQGKSIKNLEQLVEKVDQ